MPKWEREHHESGTPEYFVRRSYRVPISFANNPEDHITIIKRHFRQNTPFQLRQDRYNPDGCTCPVIRQISDRWVVGGEGGAMEGIDSC